MTTVGRDRLSFRLRRKVAFRGHRRGEKIACSVLLIVLGLIGLPSIGQAKAAIVPLSMKTLPAENIFDTGADLRGQITGLQKGTAFVFYFQYRTGAGAWRSLPSQGVLAPPEGNTGVAQLKLQLRPSCNDVEDSDNCAVVGSSSSTYPIAPAQTYSYRLCYNPQSPTCFDSAGKGRPASSTQGTFTNFTTLATDPTDLDETYRLCPVTGSSGTGYTCQDQSTSSQRANSDFYRFYRNSLHYGVFDDIGGSEVGQFLHDRGISFNGGNAQIDQSGSWLRGPGIRYDFRITIYRGEHHEVADSFRKIVPESSFSTGTVLMPTFFAYHHSSGPYHVHFRVYFRVPGVNNPSRPDGTFASSVTSTPYYHCPVTDDGGRLCKFD